MMDNRKQESYDQRFLAPLKNRPGLEPDEHFVEKLRTEISQERKINNLPIEPKWRWPVLVPMAMAVLLFSVLTASFVGTNLNMQKAESNETSVEKDNKETIEVNKEERDIYKITARNQAYQDIYRHVTKSTGSPAAARELVYYFDALENGDKKYISQVLLFEYFDNEVEEVMDYYRKVDFSTIEVEMIEQSDNGRELVTISYHDVQKNDRVKRRLLLDLSDQKHIKIFDSITPAAVNKNKDTLVKEKVEYLRENFKLGLSETDASRIFGTDYKEFVNTDSEDGSVKDWLYQFYVEEGTESQVPNESIVDFENLSNQNIGIQFWIGWSPDKKVMRISMFYTQNGKVFAKLLRPDGTVTEEEQKTGEVILDPTPFTLTEEEKSAYDSLKHNHDSNVLKDLSPVSVAKLYIQANLDRDPETEYALYTTRPDRVLWSMEEHIKESARFKTTREEILAAFQGLQNGVFIETSDFEGYIKFENKNGVQGFSMSKDPDGIWKVGFMPIQ